MKRIIDINKLYRDFGIQTAPDDHKHARDNWVQIECPLCHSAPGHEGYHLGYNISEGYFNCWRCGWHPTIEVLKVILNLPVQEIRQLLKSYTVFKTGLHRQEDGSNDKGIHTHTPDNKHVKNRILPAYGRKKLLQVHRDYLIQRNFDPNRIIEDWKISTSHFSAPTNWKWRIFIPIEFANRVVSYQARTLNQSNNDDKYRKCSSKHELIPHKQTLYGYDKVKNLQRIVVTEGVMDVWRLGVGAVAIFGTSASIEQRLLLAEFDEVYILFDTDKHNAGQIAGEKLCNQLSGYGLKVKQLILNKFCDPGDLTRFEAEKLMSDLGFNQKGE